MKQFFYKLVLKPCSWVYRKYKFRKFNHIGENVIIGKNFLAPSPENIFIDDCSSIGPNCIFYSSLAPIHIGKKVMLSANVCIVTGGHRIDVIGKYMADITNEMKLEENDKEVIIQDDVWIGMNATILKGVTIGRGSVISAGAVVVKDVPPYTIYISNDKQKARFSTEEILQHEKLLKQAK